MTSSSIWFAILISSAVMLAMRLLGYFLPSHVIERERALRIISLMPIVLLAALVGVQTLTKEQAVVVDHRLAGLVAGAIALYLKRSFITVMVVAGVVGSLAYNFL